MSWFFFFQAEDGIRDVAVTGVQTCALPILVPRLTDSRDPRLAALKHACLLLGLALLIIAAARPQWRSEERRVGKECRVGGWAWQKRRKRGRGGGGSVRVYC